jgi:pimeloyl-ACP methyl ester carboxylesterase
VTVAPPGSTLLELTANGLRFHALAAGPEDGPLVLLLHGFPELSRSWRHQLPALAEAGFRAVAPDLRGYGRTERRGPYRMGTLVADVAGLVRALGAERATVAGHDWGGAIAWATAHSRPEVVERLAILNAPHPAALAHELRHNRRQRRRSRYMLFFQLPWLPERVLTRDRSAYVARALVGGSHNRAAFPPEELEHYRAAFSEPGAMSAALAYYRAAGRRRLRRRQSSRRPPIEAPTLILWGTRDRFLGEELLRPELLAPHFAAGVEPEIVRIDDAGHFVQNEAPDRVNAELLRWLQAP